MTERKDVKNPKRLPAPPIPVKFMETFSTNLNKLLKGQNLKPKEQQN
jgi:hypothetical protein